MRPAGSRSTRSTNDSGRISQRPVRNALRKGATGSPFASIGQPKNPQKPQLLQAGRPSYGTELTPVGAGYGLYPSRCAAWVVSTDPYMSAPGGIGYSPDLHSANGLAPARPGTPTRRSACV